MSVTRWSGFCGRSSILEARDYEALDAANELALTLFLKKRAADRTEELDAERGRVDRRQARWDAEGEIAYEWSTKSYPRHPFDVLMVWKHTGWDRKDNLIYLAKEEHERITK